MGGRGGSSGVTAKSKFGKDVLKKSQNAGKETASAEEGKKKIPAGTKTQDAFISYIKHQTNIDLDKARDRMFDNRREFNIDTRELGKNDMATLRNFIERYPGGYNVSILDNGQYRKAISVKRKK